MNGSDTQKTCRVISERYIIRIYISKLFILFIHEKNDFAKVSKNLSGYRSENNFVGLSK